MCRYVLFVSCLLWMAAPQLYAQRAPDLDRIKSDVEVLTSPDFSGRGYSDGGHVMAAAFIASRFRQLNLTPLDNDFYQHFELSADVVESPPSLVLNGNISELGGDFLPLNTTGAGCPMRRYPVRRFLRGNLPGPAPSSLKDSLFVGILYQPDPESSSDSVAAEEFSLETQIGLIAEQGAVAALVPVSRLSFAPLRQGLPIPAFQILEDSLPPAIETVSFCMEIRRNTTILTQNVVGTVRGTHFPDSLIILGAHYDHLGRLSDQVYFPGANDNAGGVALLLALAETISEAPLPYTTVFIAFSGEEQGLRGSIHFASNPPISLDKTCFMINFDMVASGESGVVAVGGVDYPSAFERLMAVNARLGDRPLGKRKNVPNSDHYPFSLRGIPSFYLYANRGLQPYHSQNDVADSLDWDELLHIYALADGFLRAP